MTWMTVQRNFTYRYILKVSILEMHTWPYFVLFVGDWIQGCSPQLISETASLNCPGCPQTRHPRASTSQVVGIIGLVLARSALEISSIPSLSVSFIKLESSTKKFICYEHLSVTSLRRKILHLGVFSWASEGEDSVTRMSDTKPSSLLGFLSWS